MIGLKPFVELIAKMEIAIDLHPELTRERLGNRGHASVEITVSRDGFVAHTALRSRVARGAGARTLTHVSSSPRDTPELAAADLLEQVPLWAEAFK